MIAKSTESRKKPMMSRVFGILALIIVTAITGYGCHSTNQEVKMPIKLYYVNIGEETFLPVTSDEMEKKGRYCEINSVHDVQTLQRILDSVVLSPAKPFSDKSTRVKLIDKDGSLMAFIDNYGGIRFADGRDGRMSATDLEHLRHIIESRCGF